MILLFDFREYVLEIGGQGCKSDTTSKQHLKHRCNIAD